MADRKDPADVAHELGAPTANTIDGALGPNFTTWAEHVTTHVQLPDEDDDGWVEPAALTVPILQYGDGPHDYISTDLDAGQVIVRDGNDRTGRAWKFPLRSFLRFLAHAQGKKLPGDDEEKVRGDSMYEAAVKLQERTNRLRAAEQDAAAAAKREGRSSTEASNRAVADRTVAAQTREQRTGK